jgi:hypothetical protein
MQTKPFLLNFVKLSNKNIIIGIAELFIYTFVQNTKA